MADYTTAARPYARAVYTLAKDSNSVDSWGETLNLMAAVASDAAMQEVLDNPQLSKEMKGELMIQVLGDKANQQQQNLIKLMAENGRLKAVQEVADQF